MEGLLRSMERWRYVAIQTQVCCGIRSLMGEEDSCQGALLGQKLALVNGLAHLPCCTSTVPFVIEYEYSLYGSVCFNFNYL